MCLFESIRITDHKIPLLEYHQERINRSSKEYLKLKFIPDLTYYLKDRPKKGLYKARLSYSSKTCSVTYIPYTPKEINKLGLFFIGHDIHYDYKFEDRSFLNGSRQLLQKFDDLILIKNNLITDSTYCNIALEKKGKWYSPKNPLLKGTERQRLLDNKKIELKDIKLSEIQSYNFIKLFNAMIPFESAVKLSTKNIYQNM